MGDQRSTPKNWATEGRPLKNGRPKVDPYKLGDLRSTPKNWKSKFEIETRAHNPKSNSKSKLESETRNQSSKSRLKFEIEIESPNRKFRFETRKSKLEIRNRDPKSKDQYIRDKLVPRGPFKSKGRYIRNSKSKLESESRNRNS